jgi:hypothetical protein
MKKIIKLSIILEPNVKDYATLRVKEGTVIINGNDINGYDFECGNCDGILAKKISYKQILNIVLFCNNCKKYNVVKHNWESYVFNYINEKINYFAIIVGFILMLVVSINTNIPIETKTFANIIIFLLAFNYKSLEQVFREK